MSEIVYVLTNPAMPGMVKIGVTSAPDTRKRMGQLYTPGVPVPFVLEFAANVEHGSEIERALHISFSPYRVNPKREFFRIDAEQACAILRQFHSDVTNEINQQPSPVEVDDESLAAGEQLRRRRPNMNFEQMGIPIGSVLHYIDGDSIVTITSSRKVKLGDEEMSLTAATRQIANSNYDLPPAIYWTFNGRLLKDIYDETYDVYVS